MSILYAIILGIVQGLTEFLPVSSSGHLVLVNKLFGESGDFLFVAILLHLATLLAVVIVFRKDILYLIRHPFSLEAKKLYIATVPTVIIVLIFEGFIENTFGGNLLPYCFLITAILLFIAEMLKDKKPSLKKEISYRSAFLMGISQGIAVLPGISRSGSTICTGLFAGENREEVAKFSFLMSIPIIIASMLYEVLGAVVNKTPIFVGNVFPVIIAFLFAFIVGIFAIKVMLKIVSKAKYFGFSIYLIIVAILSFFII